MKALKRDLKLKGWRVLDLAGKINISETAIYSWLKKKSFPTAPFVKKMIDVGISEEAALNPAKEIEI